MNLYEALHRLHQHHDNSCTLVHWAVASAFLAALTAIFAKIGIQGVD